MKIIEESKKMQQLFILQKILNKGIHLKHHARVKMVGLNTMIVE
jgi:hypothetical protein